MNEETGQGPVHLTITSVDQNLMHLPALGSEDGGKEEGYYLHALGKRHICCGLCRCYSISVFNPASPGLELIHSHPGLDRVAIMTSCTGECMLSLPQFAMLG